MVLNALVRFGFDEVFEVAKAAEIVSAATRKLMESHSLPRPVISSACPAVTRLIRVRFPGLIDQVLPLNAPIEVAARMAKRAAARKRGCRWNRSAQSLSPPARQRSPQPKCRWGLKRAGRRGSRRQDIYPRLLPLMKDAAEDGFEMLSETGKIGLSWEAAGANAPG